MDIVDSCRIWESHAEPVAIENWCQDPVDSQPKLLMPPPVTGSSEFRVRSVMALDDSPWRVNRELLIRNVLEAVGARREAMSGRLRSRELELLLRDVTPVGSVVEEKTSSPASLARRGNAPSHGQYGGPWSVFLLWILWTWCEPMSTIRQIFPLLNAGMVGGRMGWTNTRRRTGPLAGKRGMVRAGGLASRTISDSNTPDPGGGGGHHPAWKRPKDDTHGP